jgi:hypothetical protein
MRNEVLRRPPRPTDHELIDPRGLAMSFASPATRRVAATLTGLLGLSLVACGDGSTVSGASATLTRGDADAGVHRQYGTPVRLGNGRARTYVVLDAARGNVPIELGVALDEAALEGLPAPTPHAPGGGDGHEHLDMHSTDVPMPAVNPTPIKFLELDWNPQGHELPGIYDVPHFDFHFYAITPAERDAIVPSDPQFQQRADNHPAAAYRLPFFSTLTPPGVPTPAVPRMGVHWIDVRTPELQGLLGNPAGYRPFTTTFIHGSWDGRFVFYEPMVTRAFILGRKTATTAAQRDSVIALPTAERYQPAGYYPSAYRIAYDAQAREYRIALTQLTARD